MDGANLGAARPDVAVFRTRDDSVFALEGRWPDQGGDLSQGIVHGTTVTFPQHNRVTSFGTGQARAPGFVHHVNIEEGRILLALA